MIASLSGILFVKHPGHIIIDVGGVGYEVQISSRTYDRLPGTGEEVFLYIHTSVREDAITLFGFAQAEEKDMYLLLNTVSGVGPRLALGILSGISARDLGRAISLKDIARLTALPGVGKKTAERICVELKDKAGKLYIPEGDGERVVSEESMVEGDNVQDALSALMNLGYPQTLAWQALRKVQKRNPETIDSMKVEELIREALRSLA